MTGTTSGSFIEGVGDEIVYGLTGIAVFAATSVALLSYWIQGGPHRIHPQSEETVQEVRDQLRESMPNGEVLEERPPPSAPPANAFNPDRNCPICITSATFAVETNCGHLFCGGCMVSYWEHGNWLGAVRCPVCRQQVNILLKSFTAEENRFESELKTQVVSAVNRYNRRFSGQPLSWMDYIRDLPTILRHCARHFFSVGGLLVMFRLRIVVCFVAFLLYFISPLDIIPEAVFGVLGFLDDIFILFLLAIYVSIIYRRLISQEAHADS